MAHIRVEINGRGMRELLNDPGVGRELLRRAELVASAARATAPVVSGAYKSSIETSTDTTDRVIAQVSASVPYALRVEASRGTLARALDAAGG